ncbi:MAG: hypothetical protein MSA61_09625, partial [Coriobacteriaceae bacterium]|nr:hypothetical protein [Coriobacteriaceae bacterium]
CSLDSSADGCGCGGSCTLTGWFSMAFVSVAAKATRSDFVACFSPVSAAVCLPVRLALLQNQIRLEILMGRFAS